MKHVLHVLQRAPLSVERDPDDRYGFGGDVAHLALASFLRRSGCEPFTEHSVERFKVAACEESRTRRGLITGWFYKRMSLVAVVGAAVVLYVLYRPIELFLGTAVLPFIALSVFVVICTVIFLAEQAWCPKRTWVRLSLEDLVLDDVPARVVELIAQIRRVTCSVEIGIEALTDDTDQKCRTWCLLAVSVKGREHYLYAWDSASGLR